MAGANFDQLLLASSAFLGLLIANLLSVFLSLLRVLLVGLLSRLIYCASDSH